MSSSEDARVKLAKELKAQKDTAKMPTEYESGKKGKGGAKGTAKAQSKPSAKAKFKRSKRDVAISYRSEDEKQKMNEAYKKAMQEKRVQE